MKWRNIRWLTAVTALLCLSTGSLYAQKEHSLREFNDAGQIVCYWKKGEGESAVKQLKEIGLDIIFFPPNERFAACRSGKLTEDQIAKLKALPSIEFIEPDVKLILERQAETPKNPPVNAEMVNAYEHAGRMVCYWKPGKKKEVDELIKKLGLVVEFAPPGEQFIQCSWKAPLAKEVLEKLSKSELLEFVEPEVSLIQEKAGVGRVIEFESGTIRAGTSPSGNLMATPEDPDLNKLWGMKKIRAYDAWSKVRTTDVTVAIIDSGIDYNHPDLKANIWTNTAEIPGNGKDDDNNGIVDDFYGPDYTVLKSGVPTGDPLDGNGHGSHVAGTIGAVGNNKVGVAGVNWRAKLMALKVFNEKGEAPYGSALAAAMGYVIRAKAGGENVRVMNMSLRWNTDSINLRKKFDEADKAGIIVVCAAGNLQPGEDPKFLDNEQHPQYPASFEHENVISVANITEQGDLNKGSHFGSKSVDLGAPGTDIYSTYPVSKGSYASLTGTSMASPHVAGSVALIWGMSEHKNSEYKKVKQLILDKTSAFNPLKGKSVTGGVLDLGFLGELKPTPPPTRPNPPHVVIICPPPRCYIPCPPRPHQYYRFRCG